MPLYKHKYRVESTRLQGWDYSRPGAYLVTICTKGMIHFFGEIEIDDKSYSIDEIRDLVHLNETGMIVEEEWLQTEVIRENVVLDEFVVMPNHFHGIIFITKTLNENNPGRDALNASPLNAAQKNFNNMKSSGKESGDALSASLQDKYNNKFGSQSNNLSSIIRGFKSSCTSRIHNSGMTNFAWQGRFHEHIIRNEKSLNKIRQYIIYNPLKWKFDKYYGKGKY